MNLVTLGGPITDSGRVEELTAVVSVRNKDGAIVRFDDANVASADGEFLELNTDSEDGSVRLYLPEGDAYTFQANAYDRSGNLLAAAESERVVVTATNNSWAVPLVSVMGAAQLVPRLPTNFVIPGQELDLTFTVSALERPDLWVPIADFSADYSVTNGVAVAQPSSRGVRLRVGHRSEGDVEVVATATGLVTSEESVVAGERSAQLRLPFHTSIVVDTEPPTLSDLAYDPVRQAFTGVTDDDMAVVQVTVWDGPVLLATTDPRGAVEGGLPEIGFPGGGTAFLAYLELPAGGHTLTVVSADYSGNEASLDLEVTVP